MELKLKQNPIGMKLLWIMGPWKRNPHFLCWGCAKPVKLYSLNAKSTWLCICHICICLGFVHVSRILYDVVSVSVMDLSHKTLLLPFGILNLWMLLESLVMCFRLVSGVELYGCKGLAFWGKQIWILKFLAKRKTPTYIILFATITWGVCSQVVSVRCFKDAWASVYVPCSSLHNYISFF